MLNLQIVSVYCILCLSLSLKKKEDSVPTPMTSDLNLIVELAFTCILWSLIVIYDLKMCLIAICDLESPRLPQHVRRWEIQRYSSEVHSLHRSSFCGKKEKSKNNPHALFTGST